MAEVLGRTNRVWADEWWRLIGFRDLEHLGSALRENSRPVLADGSPSIWANELRGAGCDWLVTNSGGCEFGRSEEDAAGKMMGEIVQAVSCSPDGNVAIWFLTVAKPWEEYQINGALAALDSAREEGLVRHLGLHVAEGAMAVASLWRFHDAFDVVLCRPGDELDGVVATARERRVGVVQDGGEGLGIGPVLRRVEGFSEHAL
ncbi:MAG: hypothetical protein ACKVQS_06665 [Fimbriimonadaceae bacterium]